MPPLREPAPVVHRRWREERRRSATRQPFSWRGLHGRRWWSGERLQIGGDDAHTLIAVPRYDAFRDALLDLARSRTRLGITEIAGNDEIFLTGVAATDWSYAGYHATSVNALPLPTDVARKRVTLRVPVQRLRPLLAELDTDARIAIDHVYDY